MKEKLKEQRYDRTQILGEIVLCLHFASTNNLQYINSIPTVDQN